DDDPELLAAGVRRVLGDVRTSVEDWPQMKQQAATIVDGLASEPTPLPADEVRQAADLLTWLTEEHFTFLGYREYELVTEDVDGAPDDVLRPVVGTGLGILRDRPDDDSSVALSRLPETVKAKAREK